MTKEAKEKLAVRIAMLTMSFRNNSIEETKIFLRDWKLKDLYELISGKYHYLDEQLGVIVDVIEEVAEKAYEEMTSIYQRLVYLDNLGTVPDEVVGLIRLIVKLRKEMPKEEFDDIARQDPEWKVFFKSLPKLKKKYNLN